MVRGGVGAVRVVEVKAEEVVATTAVAPAVVAGATAVASVVETAVVAAAAAGIAAAQTPKINDSLPDAGAAGGEATGNGTAPPNQKTSSPSAHGARASGTRRALVRQQQRCWRWRGQ